MSDYLTSLTLRNLNPARGIRPRLPSRFEPRNRKGVPPPGGTPQNPETTGDRNLARPALLELLVKEVREEQPVLSATARQVRRTVIHRPRAGSVILVPEPGPEHLIRPEERRERTSPETQVAAGNRMPVAGSAEVTVVENVTTPQKPAGSSVSAPESGSQRERRDQKSRKQAVSPGQPVPADPEPEQPVPEKPVRKPASSRPAESRQRRPKQVPGSPSPLSPADEPGDMPALAPVPQQPPVAQKMNRAPSPVSVMAAEMNPRPARRVPEPRGDDGDAGRTPASDRAIQDRSRHTVTGPAGPIRVIAADANRHYPESREKHEQKTMAKEPRVQVTIGRIEIHSLTPEESRKQRAGPPALNLDDYLQRHARRGAR
jgi:hypothetical protein